MQHIGCGSTETGVGLGIVLPRSLLTILQQLAKRLVAKGIVAVWLWECA